MKRKQREQLLHKLHTFVNSFQFLYWNICTHTD